jgi:hypothetical protein
MFSQAMIFIAFGVGLDPRQAKVFGSALAPILVGASLALGTFSSSLIKPGYSGVGGSYRTDHQCRRMAANTINRF